MKFSRRSLVALALLTLSLLAGVALAVRLVQHHEIQVYGDASAALANCPETETINCEVVNTSPWSELFGVPIAAFAIPTYLLVLGLAWLARGREDLYGYAFSIGILTTAYSAFLFWVSSMKIGYVCLYCLSLYGINLSIPLLAAVAAWRSPLKLLSRTARDLATWPRTLRWTAVGFLALLAGTVGVQHAYRLELQRVAAEQRARIEEDGGPLLPAVPPGSAPSEDAGASSPQGDDRQDGTAPPPSNPNGPSSRLDLPGTGGASRPIATASMIPFGLDLLSPGSSASAQETPGADAAGPAAAQVPGGIYRLAGSLRRISGSKQKFVAEPYDLQGKIGHGRPVALLFWAPGFPESEQALVKISSFMRRETPKIDLYAVSGRREDQREEEIWERFSMLDVPGDLPLLIDDKYVVSEALTTVDVPDLTLFDAKGSLIVAKIKDLQQMLVSSTGKVGAEDLVRRVGAGSPVDQIRQMYPFYPSADLLGRRVPSFTAKKFDTQETYTFTGRSSSGKPTLVMFWSSTCKHCQQEIPQMVEWVKTHPGAVDIVSVTHLKRKDGSDEAHRKLTETYIRLKGIPWIVLEDPDGAIDDLYRSVSTPTTFIVSPTSCVADIWYYAHSEGSFGAAMDRALARAASATECGQAPPPAAAHMRFSVADREGKRHDLASLLDKPALVHFWATWCLPCREELPSLVHFRDSVEKSGAARVLLVSVEGEDAGGKIEEFEKSIGLDLRSYRAPEGGLADRLDLGYRVPRTYLVAPDGEVLALHEGNQKWDDPDVVERVRSRLDVLGNPRNLPAAVHQTASAR